MPCSSPDFHERSFRIKHEDGKFFSKLLSKETSSQSSPTFGVYFGDVSGAVPFTWETRPGTPKHFFSEDSRIPPLTPPPSYYTFNFSDSSRKSSRSKLLLDDLRSRVSPKKAQVAASSLSSSSSLSSVSWSSSSLSDPMPDVRRRRRFLSWGSRSSSFAERAAADDRRADEVRASRLCLGISNEEKRRGSFSAATVKKAFLSIVGRGSAA